MVATFTIVAIAPSAGAATAPTLRPGDRYVALGSSFASGPMIPDTADQSCLRSTNNYPGLVAAALKLSLTDVSCGAATFHPNAAGMKAQAKMILARLKA